MSPNRPKYNDWTVVRRIAVDGFEADPDWLAKQNMADALLRDLQPFTVPNLPGRTADGFALLLVCVDEEGEPVPPDGARAQVELYELVRHVDSAAGAHVCVLEDPEDPEEPWAFVLPANLVKPVRRVGGAQNQYAVRVSGLVACDVHEVRLLVKPLGA